MEGLERERRRRVGPRRKSRALGCPATRGGDFRDRSNVAELGRPADSGGKSGQRGSGCTIGCPPGCFASRVAASSRLELGSAASGNAWLRGSVGAVFSVERDPCGPRAARFPMVEPGRNPACALC